MHKPPEKPSRRQLNEPEIKHLARTGFAATMARQAVAQVAGIAAWVVLAKYLSPGDFGIFTTVGLVIQAFTIVAELGLGLALVRQKNDPSDEELDAAWTLQFLATTTACLLAPIAAVSLPRLFAAAKPVDVLLALTLAASAWVGFFRVIPNAILERRLDFTRIAVAELSENMVFSIVAVAAAVSGCGVWSLVFASAGRSLTGSVMLQAFSGRRIRACFNFRAVRHLLLTGLGFQSFSVVSFVKDLAMPAFMVTMVGTVQFGYFVWARDFVLKFVTFSRLFGKVAMPTFARLSSMSSSTTRALRRSSGLLGLFYWPLTVALIGASGFYIPWLFSSRWLPAQPVVIVLSLMLTLQIWCSPLWSLIQAASPGRWPLRCVAILTTFEIVAGFFGVRSGGISGAALIMLASNLLALLLYRVEFRRLCPGKEGLFRPAGGKLIANAVLAGAGWWLTTRGGLDFGWQMATTFLLAAGACALNWLSWREDREMLAEILGWIASLKSSAGDPRPESP